MAFTVAEISGPHSAQTHFPFGNMRGRLYTFTPDNSYDNTNGETITAATLGLTAIMGAIIVSQPYNSGSKLSLLAIPTVSTDKQTLTFRFERYDGASAGKASLEDAANAFDASTYPFVVLIFGF